MVFAKTLPMAASGFNYLAALRRKKWVDLNNFYKLVSKEFWNIRYLKNLVL